MLQNRDSPAGRRIRRMKAVLPFSTRSPSVCSRAGSKLSAPASATNTTIIAPSAIDVKIPSPVRSMPAIAISTVALEIGTA